MVRFAWMAAALATATWLPAPAADSSVEEIVALVRTAIHNKESDDKLARALRKLTPAERLDDRTIEELESSGAGPKAIAELVDLREASAQLPRPMYPPLFPSPPAPSPNEWNSVLQDAAVNAISYVRRLPDFICTQTVSRYERFRNAEKWRMRDTLTVKLTYFEYHEKYDLVAVNNRPAHEAYRSTGGTVTEGEFGSTLLAVFNPTSKAAFRWSHWTRLRGHTAHVFAYSIDAAHSTYRLEFGQDGGPLATTVPGAHGFVYVDRETGEILRLIRIADIDPDFAVKTAVLYVDYDYAEVAGRRHLVPWRSDTFSSTELVDTRNYVSFHDYRKFEGESTITFETPGEEKR
jgi:hypothetical protein